MRPRRPRTGIERGLFVGLALIACASQPDFPKEVLERLPDRAVVPGPREGPAVVDEPSGPARFARALYERFDADAAMDTVRFVDGFYRAPANDGFEASLDRVAEKLRAAGFADTGDLLLEVLSTPLDEPAWTPLSAKLELESRGDVRLLHAFAAPGDADRTMLPVGAPSGSASGRPVFDAADVQPGAILVVDKAAAGDGRAASERGASAVLVASLEDYNIDRSKRERHRDAIQFRSVRPGSPIPVLQISRRSFDAIRKAAKSDPKAILRVQAEVRTDARALRTLVATVVGADRAGECVAVVAHVQEPGAVDNASGVGGICELACSLAALLRAEPAQLERPSRSVVFLFGDEMRASRIWLDAARRTTVAAISADMIGASREKTGARALLERCPDPGAVKPLPPDAHTEWGSSVVKYDQLSPNGVNVVLRTALADVGALAGGWPTSEHPYEGGSDHDVFLQAGVPAALVWHFTDFAYHTSLDRLEHVDPEELRRMACAAGAAALALADPRPADLDRYLRTNLAEKKLRVVAAEVAKDEELARQWESWSEAVRQWFRRECLKLAPAEAPEKKR